ncbi:hypothetical protein [Novipirellula rosea]|uniref:Uncharacterized protein n=1 Tax=Novipirellula rosea TaxID=1031540 RepID=A0ABP8NDB7_9BACT
MATKTTRGEIAALAARLPQGKLYDWCASVANSGMPTDVVYVGNQVLSDCRQAAISPLKQESKTKTKSKKRESKKNEDLQRQQGRDLDVESELAEDSKDAGSPGAGPAESESLPADSEQPD